MYDEGGDQESEEGEVTCAVNTRKVSTRLIVLFAVLLVAYDRWSHLGRVCGPQWVEAAAARLAGSRDVLTAHAGVHLRRGESRTDVNVWVYALGNRPKQKEKPRKS